MRFYNATFILLLALSACQSVPECANSDINSFDSFLGVSSETKEIELPAILGETSGGYYTENNASFVYTYYAVKDVLIAVSVNAKTSRVETIVMEIISLGENFSKDLDLAKKHFRMDDCDSRFFGMKKEELIESLGEPQEQETLEGGVTSLTYNSKNFKTSVNFKFYPEQEHMCTALIINWI